MKLNIVIEQDRIAACETPCKQEYANYALLVYDTVHAVTENCSLDTFDYV